MNNLIIPGFGRSGTSMVAALFRNSGAYFGEDLIDSTPANPHGYYECRQINHLNNQLINMMLHTPAAVAEINRTLNEVHMDERAYWLAAPSKVPLIEVPDKFAKLTTR